MKNKNSILPFNIREGASHFYFFYELTGSLLVYQDLMKGLSPHFSIYGLSTHIPKSQETLKEKSEDFAKILIKQQPQDNIYHLGGYSFGALLAIETAYRLSEMGKTVGLVLLIDSPPLKKIQQTSYFN